MKLLILENFYDNIIYDIYKNKGSLNQLYNSKKYQHAYSKIFQNNTGMLVNFHNHSIFISYNLLSQSVAK